MSHQDLRILCRNNPKRVLRIVYKDASNDVRTRFVRPYEIKEDNKFSYLFAVDMVSPHESIRKFRLDRIETAAVTQMTFTPVWPLHFD